MNVFKPSIRRRLIIGSVSTVAFITLVGSIVIYLAQRNVLMDQLDDRLKATAELLVIEIEIEDGEPYQEWLDQLLDNQVRRERDLIQVWGVNSGETYKSPALKAYDLPKIHEGLNEVVIQNITLPGDKKGRALGVKILPSYDEGEPITAHSLKGLEHIFVIALETENLEQDMTKLRQTLTWVVILTLAITAISISQIIRRSLIPIQELTQKLQQRQNENVGNQITIPNDFPEELRDLIDQYNRLLKRIEKVRIRERDFSTNAAHELRTPLSGIQATLEQAVASHREPEDYNRRIKEALTISKQMAKLVTQLMRFSRLQNESTEVILEEVNFHELIETTWHVYSEKCETNRLKGDMKLLSNEFILNTDDDLARILITNLIYNAISHSEKGSTIQIKTFDRNEQFVLSISNYSATNLPSDLNRIFDPFFRVDQARTGDGQHSGIGLSLCREIAKTLNIQIDVSALNNRDFQIELIFSTSN